MQAALQRFGAGDVLLAASAEEARAALAGGEIDLVVVDLRLADAAGLVGELREAGLAAIGMAGRRGVVPAREALPVLRLPVDDAALAAAIRAALAASGRRD